MRLVFRRSMHTTGRQLRHLIGAAIHPPTRSPENVDGQEGRNHAALLAVSTSRSSHHRVNHPHHRLWPGPSLMTEMRFHLCLRCWVSGHEDFVRTAAGRLYLECMECGRQTTGWRIGKSREPREAGRIDEAPGAVGCARPSTTGNRAALKVA